MVKSKAITKNAAIIDQIRDYYFTSLAVCFIGIIGLYSGHGFFQELLFGGDLPVCMKNFILGFTCLGGATLSGLIIKCAGLGNPLEDFTQDDFIVASMINGAQISSSFAVQFTGFPLMALAKASKIIPVMVIG